MSSERHKGIPVEKSDVQMLFRYHLAKAALMVDTSHLDTPNSN